MDEHQRWRGRRCWGPKNELCFRTQSLFKHHPRSEEDGACRSEHQRPRYSVADPCREARVGRGQCARGTDGEHDPSWHRLEQHSRAHVDPVMPVQGVREQAAPDPGQEHRQVTGSAPKQKSRGDEQHDWQGGLKQMRTKLDDIGAHIGDRFHDPINVAAGVDVQAERVGGAECAGVPQGEGSPKQICIPPKQEASKRGAADAYAHGRSPSALGPAGGAARKEERWNDHQRQRQAGPWASADCGPDRTPERNPPGPTAFSRAQRSPKHERDGRGRSGVAQVGRAQQESERCNG